MQCFRWLFFLLGLLAYTFSAQAQEQTMLRGRVVDEKTEEPIAFATVYLTSTSIGAITDAEGRFSFALPAGQHQVVVSYMGYEPLVYSLTAAKPPHLLFKLRAREDLLQAVEITDKRDTSWYQNLAVFKEVFLGSSKVARSCLLVNPEVLIIWFDPETGLLEVKATDVLQIENPTLGYRIHYLLEEFQYQTRTGYVSIAGYPGFTALEGRKGEQRRWNNRREEAYLGSSMHFVRALHQQQLEEQGFNLRRLVRTPNPNRPSEEELQAARAQLRQRGPNQVLAQDDPIAITLSKASLPKVLEKLLPEPVPYSQYLRRQDGQLYLTFDGYFQVVYTGEKEEEAYVAQASRFLRTRKPTYQTSVISLKTEAVALEEMGNIVPPLDVLIEGYWGWEKIGDLLPLNYTPAIP